MKKIIIQGAGFVGCSIALALAKFCPEFTIILNEKKDITKFKNLDSDVDPDGRALALNYASLDWLKKIDIYNDISNNLIKLKKIHISTAHNFGNTLLQTENIFGAVINSNKLLNVLQNSTLKLANQGKIKLVNNYDFNNIKNIKDIENTNPETIIIGADGSGSEIRKKLNFTTQYFDYQQDAHIYNITVSHPDQNTAFERFLPEYDSSIAFLPRGNNNYKLVIITANQESKKKHYIK